MRPRGGNAEDPSDGLTLAGRKNSLLMQCVEDGYDWPTIPILRRSAEGVGHVRVVVGGLGKSGTTALFFAVRSAMPVDTFCLFEPQEFRHVESPNVLAKILVHPKVDWDSFQSFAKKVFILRDPRDQVVSRLLYSIYNHTEPVSEADAQRVLQLLERKERDTRDLPVWKISEEVDRIMGRDFRSFLRGRFELCQQYWKQYPDFYRLRYEDFVRGRTRNVEQYLGLALPVSVRVDPLLNRVERTRWFGDWQNWFTPSDVDFFRPVLADLMRTFGYEDDWTLSSNPVIQPIHASGYVRQLLEQQRRVLSSQTVSDPPGLRAKLRSLRDWLGTRMGARK
jgi:hypothetical protein